MKICPYCAEQIQAAAIKCRYCRTLLVAGADGPASQPTEGKTTSGMAIASLVLGILWLYWIGSILALIFGYVARRDIEREPQRLDGRGLATAGIVLGWIGVATLVIVAVLFLYLAPWDIEPEPAGATFEALLRL